MQVFAANHFDEVQNESDPKNWHHFPTDLTPADIPTRLQKVKDLKNKWWNVTAIFIMFTLDRKVENVTENEMLDTKAQMRRALEIQVQRSQWETE
jgi:hypothetical protein